MSVSSAWALDYQYITFVPPTEVEFSNEPVALTATSTSGLPVQITLVAGPGSMAGNQLSLQEPGIITVRASQIGDSSYFAATSIERSITVNPAPLAITLTGLSATYDGTPKAVTATSKPGGIPLYITYDGDPIPPVGAGDYMIVAQAPAPHYTGSATGTLTIAPASPAITFEPPGSLAVRDRSYVLKATSSSDAPISFSLVSGPGNLSDTGPTPTQPGLFNEYLTVTGEGPVIVRASQEMNSNFEAAASVERTITATASTQDPAWYPPEFTTQPLDLTRADGVAASLSAFAPANPAATYQWQYRSQPTAPWTDVTTGVDNYDDGRSNYHGFTARLANSGTQYRCVATNDAGTAYSAIATLTVTPRAPDIWSSAQQPQDQYVAAGSTATFTVTAYGSPPIQYQWRLNGQPIPGANGPTLEVHDGVNGSRYDVVVSNAGGGMTSRQAVLNIITPPVVQSGPVDVSIPEQGQGSIAFTYTSTGPTTIQWFRNGAPLGTTNSYVQFNTAVPSDAGDYYATITNNAGTTTTNHATVRIVPTPAPTPYLNDLSMGGSYIQAAFNGVSSADQSSFTYQWYRNGIAIAGATSSRLNLPTDEVARLGEYFATATNAYGTAVGQTTRVDGNAESPYPAAHQWLTTAQSGDVLHLLYSGTPRIERYNLATRAWLSPINLPDPPVGFTFSNDACFIAFNNRVDRYALDFGSSQQVYSTSNPMRNIGLIGNYLITIETSGSTTIYHALAPSTGAEVAQSSVWNAPQKCLTFSNATRSVIGRSDYSATLKFITVGTDGTFGALQAPTDLDSSVGRSFTWGDGSLLGDESGSIYRTSDFTQVGQTGGITSDAVVAADGALYVLRIGWIARLNASLFEEARYPLTVRGARLLAHGDSLFVVRQPVSSSELPDITQVPLTAFTATQTAAAVIDPNGLAIWSPQIQSDGDSGVIIYSKLHQNIFRWSAETWGYLPSRGLPNTPNHLAASDTLNTVYFETNDYTVSGLDLANGQVRAVGPLPARINELLVTGNTAVIRSKVNSNYKTSVLVDGVASLTGHLGNHGPRPFAWAVLDRRAYYYRSSSPTDLVYQDLSPEGRIGNFERDTPYHTDAYFYGPISVSPDSKYIVVGTGIILEHRSRSIVATIPGNILSAAWSAGRLQVLRSGSNGSEVTSYDPANWAAQATMSFPGVPQALLSLRGDRTLLVTSDNGILHYRMLDSVNLAAIDPLHAGTRPEIVRQPENLTGAAGESLLLSVATRGGGLPRYQWQIRPAGSMVWTDLHDDGNIFGSSTGQLVVAAQPSTWGSARFRVVVSNAAGTVTSATSEVGLTGGSAVVAITAAGDYAAFTRADGSIWTLGGGSWGVVGDGSTNGRSEPFLLATTGRAFAEPNSLLLVQPDGSVEATGVLSHAVGNVLDKKPEFDHLISIGDEGRATLSDDGIVRIRIFSAYTDQVRHMEQNVQALYSGGGTYLMIKADGSLWGMGGNDQGQLGDGTYDYKNDPILIAPRAKLAATGGFTLYLTEDGELWGMGHNLVGQLGDGSGTNRNTPVLIDTHVRTMATGSSHTLYIKEDGSVWATGYNGYGQLGDGTTTTRLSPVHVADDGYAVAAGTDFSYLLKTDGSLWAAGSNQYGVIGQPIIQSSRHYPSWQYVTGGLPIAPGAPSAVSASAEVDSAGVRLNWKVSPGSAYEVWRSPTESRNDATLIASGITQNLFYDSTANVGQTYTYWIRATDVNGASDFSLPTSGIRAGDYAPRFTLQPTDTVVPAQYSGIMLRVAAQGGPSPTYQWQVKTPDSSEWSDISDFLFYTGTNTPELGADSFRLEFHNNSYRCVVTNSQGTAISEPATISIIASDLAPTISQPLNDQTISYGGSLSLQAYINNPTYAQLTYTWTKNGTVIPGASSSTYFIPRATFSDSGDYAFTVTASTGTATSRTATVTVLPSPAVKVVSAGEDFTVFLQDTGTPWAMGNNQNRRTGLNSGVTQYLTTPYSSNSYGRKLIGAAAGPSHSLWVDAYGAVFASGVNSYGQCLGNSGLSSGANLDAVAVAAGSEHSVILKRDGTVWTVGLNDNGQLGDGTTINRTSPVQVMSGVKAIAAGGHQTFFIKDDDSLWAVGDNRYGQLGDGTTAGRSTPVQIATQVTAVSTGSHHTLFVDRAGTLWGAGTNYYHVLTDRVAEYFQVPTPIPLATDVVSCASSRNNGAFIKSDGTLWVWGDNSGGQVGLDLTSTRQVTPRLLASDVTAVTLGAQHTAYVSDGGELWICGRNAAGQLGIDTPSGYAITPVRLWAAAPTTPVPAVTELTATQGTESTGVRLNWRAVTNSSGYSILRGTSPNLAEATAIASSGTMPMFLDTTAARDILYYYWVNNGSTSGRTTGYLSLPTGLPTITRNLTKQVICYTGTSYTFSITATGSTPLSYQYRKNGIPIAGATTASYTLNINSAADAGTYDVIVTNSVGSTTSIESTLVLGTRYQSMSFYLPDAIPFTDTPIILNATTSSGLPVIFTVDSGPATITGNQLTLTGLGVVTVTATLPGNESDEAATPVSRTFSVIASTLAPQLGGLVQAYNGQPRNVTVSGLPAGISPTITYDGLATAPTAIGTYQVKVVAETATQRGSTAGTLSIVPASQSISFDVIADRPYTTAPIALHATATSGLPVQFELVVGPALLSGATLELTDHGQVMVRAIQPGDQHYDPAPAVERSFLVFPTLTTWLADHFNSTELTDAAISGATADPDRDGLTNLLEYALGLDPKDTDTSDLPEAGSSATDWTYTYTRPADRPDLTYEVEYSTDLASWTTAGITLTKTVDNGSTQTWQATLPASSATNVFFRLKITQN